MRSGPGERSDLLRTASMVALPQELVDTIVNNLDDKASWKSCSLAAKAFVPPSQRLLFEEMTFPTEAELLGMLSELFSESPHLAGFIRWVTIETSRTLAVCSVLESLLRTLLRGQIQRLSVRGNLDRIPLTLRQAILELIYQPSVQTLDLVTFGDCPSSLLAIALASCRKVSFVCQGISVDSSGAGPVEDAPGALVNCAVEELEATVWGSSRDSLQQSGIFRNLGRLWRLEIHLRDLMAIRSACCATLTHLTLYDIGTSTSRQFPHLEALRFLTLWSKISRFAEELALIAKSLSTAVPLLEILTIVASAKFPYPPPFTNEIPRPEIDAGLATLLRLKEVNFTLLDGYGGPMEPARYRECFERVLPQALQANLLTFTFTGELQQNFFE
ncbi:hypothetical protein MSAN_02073200 [Mycena sanguinolenta]|uniref:F-box domain-containing protein n=1 Tax=Mycena sanguinolenta TaxID=230812 RepID=A0A8H6XJE0_9AGAR|nr:hypothetical protein MSAN_02073200 [Mycena sanguinolenta]